MFAQGSMHECDDYHNKAQRDVNVRCTTVVAVSDVDKRKRSVSHPRIGDLDR
jgi:hypothetical protein